MTQDFYSKAQVLLEKFQKRELHYLNTERKLNSDIMWKKNHNFPLQEYLQKISQKEKETGENYRNILKQMEELDRHTDVMSLKLEKLRILQRSVTSVATPNWSQRLDPNIGSNLQTFNTISDNTKTSNLFSLKSVSTQTDNVMYCVCEKCNFLILTDNQPNHMVENLPSSSNTYFGMDDKPKISYSIKSQHDSGNFLKETHMSQYIISGDKEHHLIQTNDRNFTEENSKNEKQPNNGPPEEKLHCSVETDENKNNSYKNGLQLRKDSVAKNDDILSNKGKVDESQCTANENKDDIQTGDAEPFADVYVSKSDAESMNNEFDFLESDAANIPNKIEIENSSINVKSSTNDADVSLDKATNPIHELSSDPKLNLKSNKQDRNALHPNSKLSLGDDRSETSGSISGLHSPNMSIASDSDSIYDKGSPLTASAAYQALLGNTIIPRKTAKHVSDSESEDEVESVLANAVQRTHVKTNSSVKQKKDETCLQPVDAKPAAKATKVSSGNKPQSKLSKSTRKVLGLDTSSGSEVEVAVKPAGKKIDEDSDEFDFYD